MNKYQEALNTVKDSCIYLGQDYNLGDMFKEDEEALNTLQELVDTTKIPTLEEVKKEWEDDGWKWEEDNLLISLTKSNRIIAIYKHNKDYDCTRHNMWKGGTLSIKEHQLLTKTFRALGWEA